MLDDKKRAELDQAIQAVTEFLPPDVATALRRVGGGRIH